MADHCAERMPEELRKELAKTPGDLSMALESVFLRVYNLSINLNINFLDR